MQTTNKHRIAEAHNSQILVAIDISDKITEMVIKPTNN